MYPYLYHYIFLPSRPPHSFSQPPGMKPRIKNHFRAHQLSIWLRLIPELHRAGMEDVIARHNLFKNHEDPQLYDGPVKPDPLHRLSVDGHLKQRRGGSSSEFSMRMGRSIYMCSAQYRNIHVVHMKCSE